MAISALPDAMLLARVEGRHLEVTSLDKFPKLTNYVVPEGVRIADSARGPSGGLSRCGHDRHARGFC